MPRKRDGFRTLPGGAQLPVHQDRTPREFDERGIYGRAKPRDRWNDFGSDAVGGGVRAREERYRMDDVQWPDTPFDLLRHTILLGKRGSESHGTWMPPTNPDSIDDRDIMGICVPPVTYYFGLSRWEGVEAIKGCWDVVLYEFRKFLSLLTKQNPNVICMLWLRPEDYLHLTREGRDLIAARDLFRARGPAFDSFVGYARGQLQRMTHFQHQGYMGAKRKALADKYGYDCKNAAHLVRLLSMGIEYQETGRLNVWREKDRARLMEIKTGKWPLEEVKLEADKLFDRCRAAYRDSVLPEEIDRRAVDDLAVSIVQRVLGRNIIRGGMEIAPRSETAQPGASPANATANGRPEALSEIISPSVNPGGGAAAGEGER